MKIWSDRAIKTALSSVRCPLRHIKTSAQSANSFLERWALQLADYRGSGTGQQSVVQYQLSTESQRSKCLESIDRPLLNILPIPGSLRHVLASPDTEIAPQISQTRKSSEPFFSMKTSSDRPLKAALSSVRYALKHIRNSARSAHSFLERWALQLAHYWGSGTAQISVVQYQLYMESQRSASTESINRLLHSIPQLPGSLQFVLASPDTEIAPQISQ